MSKQLRNHREHREHRETEEYGVIGHEFILGSLSVLSVFSVVF
jgi:hypothetical protein